MLLRSLEEVVPRLEREKAHAEGELMKAVNAMSERESALSEVSRRVSYCNKGNLYSNQNQMWCLKNIGGCPFFCSSWVVITMPPCKMLFAREHSNHNQR